MSGTQFPEDKKRFTLRDVRKHLQYYNYDLNVDRTLKTKIYRRQSNSNSEAIQICSFWLYALHKTPRDQISLIVVMCMQSKDFYTHHMTLLITHYPEYNHVKTREYVELKLALTYPTKSKDCGSF